jgi:hypothetical protein
MRESASFTWAVMSPNDFVKFRLAEFDQETGVPVDELNPAGTWVVYVEAVDDETGSAIVSTTVVPDTPTARPGDKDAYSAARFAVDSMINYVRDQGYVVAALPKIVKARLRDEYRA